jgi:hypothetical protein
MLPDSFKLGSIAACLIVLSAEMAAAQCTPGGPPSPSAVKGAIVGVVMDSSHNVLEGVDVFVRSQRRSAKSGAQGRFQIPDLEVGIYELTVRRIGYEIAMQKIAVTDSGGIARFCLIPEPRGLPPMITSVPRGGLSGVIGDSAYAVLPGAEVIAIAAGERAISDSAGGFYLPLKKGTYAITVRKKGYGPQLLSVTIPQDSGRQIAVWLASPARSARRIAAAIEDSMKYRLQRARAASSKLLSSEDLARTTADLTMAVQASVIAGVSPDCEAVIDGGPWTLPLSLIDKADVAAVEVYAVPAMRSGPTSLDSRGTVAQNKDPSNCKVKVYVWLKP